MLETTQPAPEPPTTYREQIALLRNSNGFLRLMGYIALLYLVAVCLLGALFMAMFFLLTLAFVHLMVVYTPAYHLAGWIMRVKGLPAHLAKPPTWFLIYAWLWAAVMFGLSAIVLRLIFLAGYCPQNPLCILALVLFKR